MNKSSKSYQLWFMVLFLVLLMVLVLNISLGSVSIPFKATVKAFFGGELQTPSWKYIILNYRIPQALTAILVGGGLAVSGLLMQTLFRNPLAGPFVLGISSGASLGAALLLMGSSLLAGFTTMQFHSDVSLAIAASIGSFAVLLIVMLVANRVRDTMALLIIGLMFGSITAAIVSVLAYFSDAEQLQRFVFWSYGSVGNLSWRQLSILAITTLIGLVLSILSLKSLNAFLLGENYARYINATEKENI